MGLRGGGHLVPLNVKWSKLNEIYLDEYLIYSKVEPPFMAVFSLEVSLSPLLSPCAVRTQGVIAVDQGGHVLAARGRVCPCH